MIGSQDCLSPAGVFLKKKSGKRFPPRPSSCIQPFSNNNKRCSQGQFRSFNVFLECSRLRGVTTACGGARSSNGIMSAQAQTFEWPKHSVSFFGTRWMSCWSRGGGALSTCRRCDPPVRNRRLRAVRAQHRTFDLSCVSKPKRSFT